MIKTRHELPRPVYGVCGTPVQVREDGTATNATTERTLLTKQIKSYTCKNEVKTKERAKKLVE